MQRVSRELPMAPSWGIKVEDRAGEGGLIEELRK